jgi:prepilin-type processing-associated H-X9-DG protein
VIDTPGDPKANTESSVKAGALWKYNPSPNVYRCPSSSDKLHYRSYSIVTHLNGSLQFVGAAYRGSPQDDPSVPIVSKVAKVKPRALVFIEEYDSRVDASGVSYNQGSFLLWKKGSSLQWNWGDLPAFFHVKGTNISFGDGHVEFQRWDDKRTLTAVRNQQQLGNKDLEKLELAVYGPWQ